MQIIENLHYAPMAIIFIAMAVTCVWQAFKIKQITADNAFTSLVNSASIGGYYIWKLQGNIEKISPALMAILNLRATCNNFNSLADIFGDDKEELLQKFNELKNLTTETFIFNGHTIHDSKKIQCVGYSIIDKNSDKIVGIIIWFFDISQCSNQIETLNITNDLLTNQTKELESVINTLPIPIWKRDSDFVIRFCNFVYSEFVGSEGENNNNNQTIPELDPSLQSLSMIAKNNGRTLRMKKHVVIDGKRRFFNITEMPIKHSDEILGFAYDITDQDEIEKELARHISAHADLLESSSSAMVIYGPDTKLKFYNNAFVNLWNLRTNWLDTKPTYGEILEVLREKRKLPEQADFKQFRKEQMMLFQDITKPQEDLIHLPDGKAIRTIAIPHALGGLLFAYEDVTDRLVMERSFNTLIEVQRETLDNLSEGVALFGEDGKIRLYNPIYVKMWQEDDEYLETLPHLANLLERSKHLYCYDDKWSKFKEKIVSQILGRKLTSRREKLTNGHIIDIISRPLANGDNLVSFVDVTDSIMAEQALIERNTALEDADKIKTEFLANISYELRTPLTSIIGFSEVLQAEYFGKLNAQQMDYTHGINTASAELLALINDVLDLTSIEAGYMVLELNKFDLYTTLDSIIKITKERCRENKQSLKLVCDKKIGKINADEIRIKHIILKLLNNSMKFTKAGGNITLGAQEISKEQIKIWVEDNGIGIDEHDKKKIFARFFKTKSAQLMQKSGAGLGLAVVKNITELHGGQVTLESEQGKGTKIILILNKNGPKIHNTTSDKDKKHAK